MRVIGSSRGPRSAPHLSHLQPPHPQPPPPQPPPPPAPLPLPAPGGGEGGGVEAGAGDGDLGAKPTETGERTQSPPAGSQTPRRHDQRGGAALAMTGSMDEPCRAL